jgi:parvulin-like peptidyl-prolyl isomerase
VNPSRRSFFLWSLVLLGLAYFAGDLWVFHGPCRRAVAIMAGNGGSIFQRSEVVAEVDGQPITRAQVERIESEDLWRRAMHRGQLTGEDARASWRRALREAELLVALSQQSLIRQDIQASPQEVQAAISLLEKRHGSTAAMMEDLRGEGIHTREELEMRLAEHIRQTRLLDAELKSQISESQSRDWYEKHRDELAQPERWQVRQIFRATLNQDPEVVRLQMEVALADLRSGKKDFTTLVTEISEDERSKQVAGNLGWLDVARMPEDFSRQMVAVPLHQPALIRTKLGWHLIEVTDHKPSEVRGFDELRTEITDALLAVNREKILAERCERLRQQSRIVEFAEPGSP